MQKHTPRTEKTKALPYMIDMIHNNPGEETTISQVSKIFNRFPSIDGLVLRFGETYLHDTPFHMGGIPVREDDDGIKDHVKLINLLREEICVKRNKRLLYRTCNFGWFHTVQEVYLAINDQIEPHENLIFSIKHTKGDFLRTFSFNPTLGIGKYQQVVEVQCQREYEGKGAHPDYIAKAVINGFEEYEGMESPKCLNDLKSNQISKGFGHGHAGEDGKAFILLTNCGVTECICVESVGTEYQF